MIKSCGVAKSWLLMYEWLGTRLVRFPPPIRTGTRSLSIAMDICGGT